MTGKVPEWFKGPVLKTGRSKDRAGSNPALSDFACLNVSAKMDHNITRRKNA